MDKYMMKYVIIKKTAELAVKRTNAGGTHTVRTVFCVQLKGLHGQTPTLAVPVKEACTALTSTTAWYPKHLATTYCNTRRPPSKFLRQSKHRTVWTTAFASEAFGW